MGAALIDGLRMVRRSLGLAVLLLVVNLSLAALLTAPFAFALERDLHNHGPDMIYHLDYGIWSEWSDAQAGYFKSFAPDILGMGLVFKSAFALLRGELPGALFRGLAQDGGPDPAVLHPVILGVGVVYLALQTALIGGVLAVFRGGGRWRVRDLLRGSGLYLGRMARVALLALAAAAFVFALDAPLADWVDARARAAVSETTAVAWTATRYALLLLALALVSLVSGYAKVIVVLEERSSALRAWRDAMGVVAAHPLATIGHYAAIAGLGVVLLVAWNAVDARLATRGFTTQLAGAVVTEAMLFGVVCLRLSLLAGQMAMYRRLVTRRDDV